MTTIGATVAYLLIRARVPVIDHTSDFQPCSIWRQAGLLAVGVFVIISVFYLIKMTALRSAGSARH